MKDIAVLLFESMTEEDIVLIDPGDMHKAEEYGRPGMKLVEAIILTANIPESIPSSFTLGQVYTTIL